jgi:hypothetical protein
MSSLFMILLNRWRSLSFSQTNKACLLSFQRCNLHTRNQVYDQLCSSAIAFRGQTPLRSQLFRSNPFFTKSFVPVSLQKRSFFSFWKRKSGEKPTDEKEGDKSEGQQPPKPEAETKEKEKGTTEDQPKKKDTSTIDVGEEERPKLLPWMTEEETRKHLEEVKEEEEVIRTQHFADIVHAPGWSRWTDSPLRPKPTDENDPPYEPPVKPSFEDFYPQFKFHEFAWEGELFRQWARVHDRHQPPPKSTHDWRTTYMIAGFLLFVALISQFIRKV